jgi:hypothetical protein
MSKPNIIDFIKSIFAAKGTQKKARNLERGAMPDPLIVGFIFTVMCLMAITFIAL